MSGYLLRMKGAHPAIYFGDSGNMTMEKADAIKFMSLDIIRLYDIAHNIMNRLEIVPIYNFQPIGKGKY